MNLKGLVMHVTSASQSVETPFTSQRRKAVPTK
jgi:hypothetical protein